MEHDLDGLEKEKRKNEQKIKDIVFEIQAEKKTCSFFKKGLLGILIGFPPINLFFVDIDKIKKQMLEELEIKNK